MWCSATIIPTTPWTGPTAEDITTLVETSDGPVACTHLWWSEQGPSQDPRAEDQAELERSRARLLDLEPTLLVPGHGAPFRPGPAHLT
jgi:glyoxylase-like metal-dependent hydrolase (beta-lactamase superfamily II)